MKQSKYDKTKSNPVDNEQLDKLEGGIQCFEDSLRDAFEHCVETPQYFGELREWRKQMHTWGTQDITPEFEETFKKNYRKLLVKVD